MNRTKISRNADFLSIALEEMDAGDYESAKGFVEDTRRSLDDLDRPSDADRLGDALDALDDENYEEASDAVGEVFDELLEELDE